MDYNELDGKIVEAVRSGKTSFSEIYEVVNGVTHRTKGKVADHALLERRLQALWRRRRLTWSGSVHRSKWEIPKEATA